MIAVIATTNDRMFYEFYKKIASMSKRMEKLELKVDYTHEIIQRQQEYETLGEEAIKSFVGTWFEMSKHYKKWVFIAQYYNMVF